MLDAIDRMKSDMMESDLIVFYFRHIKQNLKLVPIVILHSKYAGALTFETLFFQWPCPQRAGDKLSWHDDDALSKVLDVLT